MNKILASFLFVATPFVPNVSVVVENEDIDVPISIQDYAYQEVVESWGEHEWSAFNAIISQESRNWEITDEHYTDSKVYINDPSKVAHLNITVYEDEFGYYYISTAYGLAGFLDSTWEMVGCEKTYIPSIQVDCAIKYIEMVYQTPTLAWDFHQANNYY